MAVGVRSGLAGKDNTLTASTALTLYRPRLSKVGDLMLAFIYHRSVLTTPPGWTVVASGNAGPDSGALTQYATIAHRVIQSADVSWSWTQASAGRLLGYTMALVGAGTPTLLSSTSGFGETTGVVHGVPAAAIPTGPKGAMVLAMLACGYGNTANVWLERSTTTPFGISPLAGKYDADLQRTLADSSWGGGVGIDSQDQFLPTHERHAIGVDRRWSILAGYLDGDTVLTLPVGLLHNVATHAHVELGIIVPPSESGGAAPPPTTGQIWPRGNK